MNNKSAAQAIIYEHAAQVTGKSETELREMAQAVFASILHHAMKSRNGAVWTVASVGSTGGQGVDRGELYVEVNVPLRRGWVKKGAGTHA